MHMHRWIEICFDDPVCFLSVVGSISLSGMIKSIPLILAPSASTAETAIFVSFRKFISHIDRITARTDI